MKDRSGAFGETVKSFLRVSRWQIQLVSIASILLGPLFAADKIGDLLSVDILWFAVFFYAVVTFSCNINCFYDVELDTLRKRELAKSVNHLGKKMISLMAAETFVATLALLALYMRGHTMIVVLGILGWLLAYTYSAPPLRIKSKGILSPIPVNIGVYILPPLAGYLIVGDELTGTFILFLAGYSLLNLGINLVNVSEDHSTDMAAGVKTISHSLGLKGTLALAGISSAVGSASVLISFSILLTFHATTAVLFILCVFTMVLTTVDISIISLKKESLEMLARDKAGKLPFYFIVTRYPMVLLLLFNLL